MKKKKTRSVQYALQWRLVCNRWRLWVTDGGWWVATKHQRADAIVKKKRLSVLMAPPESITRLVPTILGPRGPSRGRGVTLQLIHRVVTVDALACRRGDPKKAGEIKVSTSSLPYQGPHVGGRGGPNILAKWHDPGPWRASRGRGGGGAWVG